MVLRFFIVMMIETTPRHFVTDSLLGCPALQMTIDHVWMAKLYSNLNKLTMSCFQAFKFPDSMNVHFQCVVQVCRGSCPEPQCGGGSGYIDSGPISGSGSGSGFGQTSPSGVYSVQPQSPAPDRYVRANTDGYGSKNVKNV